MVKWSTGGQIVFFALLIARLEKEMSSAGVLLRGVRGAALLSRWKPSIWRGGRTFLRVCEEANGNSMGASSNAQRSRFLSSARSPTDESSPSGGAASNAGQGAGLTSSAAVGENGPEDPGTSVSPDNAEVQEVMKIPGRKAAIVIGHAGSTIKMLQRETNTKIQVGDKGFGSGIRYQDGEVEVKITGTRKDVARCVSLCKRTTHLTIFQCVKCCDGSSACVRVTF